MTDLYLSHPVRRLRREPPADERVDLVVEPADGDAADGVAAAVDDLDGDVTAWLPSGSLRVDLPSTAVDALCDRDDLRRVETANTLGLGLDVDD